MGADSDEMHGRQPVTRVQVFHIDRSLPGRCRSLYARRRDLRMRFKGPLNAQIVRQANATRRTSSGVSSMTC